MILTLKELADHLKVNERTILRMLRSGQIQGAKIGGQWRFNGSQIDQIFFSNNPENPDYVAVSELTPAHLAAPISRTINEKRMLLDMKATTVEEALGELCTPIIQNGLLMDLRDLRERLSAREKLLSTGMGQGLALPHPRDPIPTLREPAVIVVGRSKQGIDFNSVDHEPVHLFFLICCQNIQTHLLVMGRLADLLHRDGIISQLQDCDQPEDITRTILEAERNSFLTA
jgi:PTS system nitrogen regulatory IIA component